MADQGGMDFDDFDLRRTLRDADADLLHGLPFGVVRMRVGDGAIVAYNTEEERMSGLGRDRVIGRRFFDEIAPCTNNMLVADRFRHEADLDDQIDYVFTLRMRPTPVRLRLLREPGVPIIHLVVQWTR